MHQGSRLQCREHFSLCHASLHASTCKRRIVGMGRMLNSSGLAVALPWTPFMLSWQPLLPACLGTQAHIRYMCRIVNAWGLLTQSSGHI